MWLELLVWIVIEHKQITVVSQIIVTIEVTTLLQKSVKKDVSSNKKKTRTAAIKSNTRENKAVGIGKLDQ